MRGEEQTYDADVEELAAPSLSGKEIVALNAKEWLYHEHVIDSASGARTFFIRNLQLSKSPASFRSSQSRSLYTLWRSHLTSLHSCITAILAQGPRSTSDVQHSPHLESASDRSHSQLIPVVPRLRVLSILSALDASCLVFWIYR